MSAPPIGMMSVTPSTNDTSTIIQKAKWFKTQKDDDGRPYEKPAKYLAHAMMCHEATDAEVERYITQAKERMRKVVEAGSKRIRGERSWSEMLSAPFMTPKKQKRGSLVEIGFGSPI